MKKLVLAAFAASALIVAPNAFAKGPTDAGANANQNACFGQGRADYVSNNGGGGQIVSQRAQTPATDPNYANDNVQENALYRLACQAVSQSG